MKSIELRKQRAQLVADMRKISEKADAEKRALTAEERTNFDKAFEDQKTLKGDIDRIESLEAEERALALSTGTTIGGDDAEDEESEEREGPTPDEVRAEERLIARMEERGLRVNRGGREARDQRYSAYDLADREQRTAMKRAKVDARSAFQRVLRGLPLTDVERRAMEATDSTLGGSFITPVSFQREVIQAVDDLVYGRDWGTVRTLVGAKSIGFPTLDADPADADWTTELATGSEDSSMRTGFRELSPNPLAKLIKISTKLLQLDPAFEALVMQRLAYKFALPMEKHWLTGNGSGKPLGLFTPDAKGISTGRDVVGGSTTALTADPLIDVKYALKGQYRRNSRWLFHRDGVKQVAKLKDSQNQYLFLTSLRENAPDTFQGQPIFESEYVPNTFTTGLYVGMYGDFSWYWWVDALGMTIARLNELFAVTNQVGFIGRLESDGMPVLEEAFVRIKLA